MTRPRLPNRIDIGYRTLRIQEVDEVHLEDEDGGGSSHRVMGSCGIHAGEISIERGQDTEERANTLLHEMVHLILRQAGAENVDAVAEHEEYIVAMVSNGLIEVFKRNPDMVRFLQRSLKQDE